MVLFSGENISAQKDNFKTQIKFSWEKIFSEKLINSLNLWQEIFSQEFSEISQENLIPKIKVKLSFFDDRKLEISAQNSFQFSVENDFFEIKKNEKIYFEAEQNHLNFYYKNKMFKSDEIILPAENIWTLENYRHPYFGVKYNIKYNKFRGKIILSAQNNKLVIVDELPVSLYLRGLAEETKAEPLEKKKAILVLARSYAVHYSREENRKFSTEKYDLEDSPKTSQLYLGYDWEGFHPEQIAIIEKTTGQVITYQGEVVVGPYFSQSNGRTLGHWQVKYPWTQIQNLLQDKGLRQLGHVVGLSAHTAKLLAQKGKNWREILHYFFRGIVIKRVY